MNPGLAQILSVVATAGMGRVDHITVLETVDVSCHHSVDTWKNVGYGRPVDDPEVPGLLETGCTVFADSIYLMADCLDLRDRRHRLRVRARRLHRGRRPRLVDSSRRDRSEGAWPSSRGCPTASRRSRSTSNGR